MTPGKPLSATIALRGARPVKLAFFLSADRRRSRGDEALGTKLVKVHRGEATAVRLRVPRRARPLAGSLLACAERGASSCAASAQRIAVVAAPHPLRATPTPAGAAAASSIGPAGGAISLPSATMTLPPGALQHPATVSLTPIGPLGHHLPGRLLGAVEAGPPGLPLLAPATVAFSGKGTVGLAFGPDGSNIHLVPLRGGKLPVGVLEGAGALAAPRRQLRGFAQAHVAADPISQFEQLLAAGPTRKRHHHRRARISAGGGGDPELEAYALASVYQIDAVGNGDFVAGVARYQEWTEFASAYAGQIPTLPKLEAEAKAALIAAGLRQVLEDQGRCEDQHELSRRTHLLELEAAGSALAASAVVEAAQHAVAHCFQFDLVIDSQIHHVDREQEFSGGFDWHYQAKAPLDYESLLPSATSFTARGQGPGAFATATGSETSVDRGGCHDGTDVTNVVTLLSADPGVVHASGNLSVPVAPDERPRVELTLESSANEDYRFEAQDASSPECSAGAVERTLHFWWLESWLSLVAKGGTSTSRGGPVTFTLEPPTDPAAGLSVIAEETVPAVDAAGDTGQTRIQVIHDPGHLLLPGLPPA